MGIAIIYEGQLQFMHGEITEAKAKLYRIIELENKLKEAEKNKKYCEFEAKKGISVYYSSPTGSGQFRVNEALLEIIQPILLESLEMDINTLRTELNELTK